LVTLGTLRDRPGQFPSTNQLGRAGGAAELADWPTGKRGVSEGVEAALDGDIPDCSTKGSLDVCS
jgi:hypothetical protein